MDRVWFEPYQVVDRATGRPRIDVRGVVGTICLVGTNTPAVLQDATGNPLSAVMTITEDSYVPGFSGPAGVYEYDWVSGEGIRQRVFSYMGVLEAARSLEASAAASALAAQAAVDAATKIAVIPYGGSTDGYPENTLIVELPPGVTI